jgi:hypothetical protein
MRSVFRRRIWSFVSGPRLLTILVMHIEVLGSGWPGKFAVGRRWRCTWFSGVVTIWRHLRLLCVVASLGVPYRTGVRLVRRLGRFLLCSRILLDQAGGGLESLPSS